MRHLVVGAPMYGGQCSDLFNNSMRRLDRLMVAGGHKLTPIFLGNESLINRARNTIVHLFMQGPGSHLLFWDADVGCRAEDVAAMMDLDLEVVAGAVPLKGIDWQGVVRAAQRGVPADELAKHGGVFPDYKVIAKAGGLLQIERVGGFVLIKRSVFVELDALGGLERYTSNLPGNAIPFGAEVIEFYPSHVVAGELLSEDHGFCRAWRGIGGTIWLAPWCQLTHSGTFVFNGEYDPALIALKPVLLKDETESDMKQKAVAH